MKRILTLSLLLTLSLGQSKAQQFATVTNDYSIILHNVDNVNISVNASVTLERDATAFIVCNQKQTPVKMLKANQAEDFLLEEIKRKDMNDYQLFFSYDGGETVLSSEPLKFTYPTKNIDDFHFSVSSYASINKANYDKLAKDKPLFHIDLSDISKNEFNTYCQSIAALSSSAYFHFTPCEKLAKSLLPTQTGLPYYSEEYGDVLVVVLDPFTYTKAENKEESWLRTLSEAQYDWLKGTLQKSDAKYKFIFIHYLYNTNNSPKAFEWGASEADMKLMRKGWKLSVHDLLKKNKVSGVFYNSNSDSSYEIIDGVNYVSLGDNQARKVEVNKKGFTVSSF